MDEAEIKMALCALLGCLLGGVLAVAFTMLVLLK